jgi:hypothetical protein
MPAMAIPVPAGSLVAGTPLPAAATACIVIMPAPASPSV